MRSSPAAGLEPPVLRWNDLALSVVWIASAWVAYGAALGPHEPGFTPSVRRDLWGRVA
jgi:hypothetical protein